VRTVFFDIDTQIDFVYPAGALYAPGAETILPAVERLNRHAASHGIPVISTTDAHTENDPEFRTWPHHCVAGTLGQRKPQATLLESQFVIPSTTGDYRVDGARQFIVQKQLLDCFSNPNLPRLLEQFNAERYVVYGVVTEFCVRCAALGLLRTGRQVELVTDAVRSLKDADARRTLEEFASGGGVLTTLSQVC
jgi:nicotinamidase/pyrazinamidase